MERELCEFPKVVLMLPLGCAAEAPQEQVMARIVPGVLYIDILEQTEVHSKHVVHPVLNLLDMMDHYPCP